MKKGEKRRAQGGFTLIEIIAVLVILGVLAAVAVPKYLDMATSARNRSAEGAVAAAQSALSMAYANLLLTNGSVANVAAVVTAAGNNCGVTSSEFTVACPGGVITATGNANTNVAGGTATATWTLPQ